MSKNNEHHSSGFKICGPIVQEAFKNPSRLFEAFMENSPAQAWIADGECRMYYMNKSYRDTFNVGDEMLLKRPEIFPSEFLKMYEENNRRVIANNKPLDTIEDGYDQNGLYKIFKVCKFPLGVHHNTALIGAWMIDLTSELKAKKELHQINERYLFASRATSDIIWEWFIKEDTIFIADGYEATFGYSGSIRLEDLQAHTHPDDFSSVHSSFAEFLQSGNNRWQMEFRIVCKNGDIKFVLNNAFVVRNDEGIVVRVIGALRDMTDLKVLQAKLDEQHEDKRKNLLRAVIEAQEKERIEIGKELHDNVNQILTAAKLMIESARKNPGKVNELLFQSELMIGHALHENRALSHRLIPPSLEAKDFEYAVKILTDILNLSDNIKATVELPSLKEIASMESELRLSVYRIIQEQIGNILKHAKAKNVQIQLAKTEKEWVLVIDDDGSGFDVVEKRKGIGIKNIYSRAESHNGYTRIISSPGHGCMLYIRFPALQ